MIGHTAPPRGRVSLLGVIAGGLLIGAGGFGLFRMTNANPSDLPSLPPVPPLAEVRPDPIGLPVVPAGGPITPVLPPLSGVLPKPGEVAPPPAPLPAPTMPMVPSPVPTPTPAALAPVPTAPVPAPAPMSPELPKIGELPSPGGFEPPALPGVNPPPLPVPAPKPVQLEPIPAPKPAALEPIPAPKPAQNEVVPAPKPVQLDPVPMPKPTLPPAPVDLEPLPAPTTPAQLTPPVNPESNLQSLRGPNNVNPRGPVPTEVPPAPRPVVTVLPSPTTPHELIQTPGDPPVPLTLRQTVLSAALGVGFALAPTPVVRAEEPMKPAPTADVEVKKQIEDLKKEVAALRKQNEVQADYILGRSDGKILQPVDQGLLKRVQTLEEAIARIEKKLDTTKQVAGASPIREGSTTTGNGTIRLINEYPTPVRIVVNGTSHELKANELKELIIPAGEFVYELIAAGATKTTSTIKDTERVTLRIR